jgi:peptide/nickel transport system substrate-binding protein
MNRDLDSIDTAVAYDTAAWPVTRMTNDGLVAFNQVSGLAGTEIVPDLAVSLPTPTAGGRTWSFQLRSNIRYSNGAVLKASDFRRAFERDFSIGKFAVQYYEGIVGAKQCERHRSRCNLSHGIVADNVARTVTFHLVGPDPDFLEHVALDFAYAVPTGTPLKEIHTHPLPATGPYMIVRYRPNHLIELRRNPYFHEWSKAAQPDGYTDRIEFAIGGTPDKALGDVIAGNADAFSTVQSQSPPSASSIAAVRTAHASQLHTNPQPGTIALFLNTRAPPFNRLSVRRALNYAADRAAAVQVEGGPDIAQATCQILPPHFQGYKPYCPEGTVPDLVKARALIAASGTRGMKVTFWASN